MRDERSWRQRSGLAWLTGALALAGAARASAQECGSEVNCGPGYVCGTSQGTSCSCVGSESSDGGARDAGSATTPPPDKEDASVWLGDSGSCEIVCSPYEYHYCTAAPCSADADCPSSMVCQTQTYYECSGEGTCKPGEECAADAGAPDGGYGCTEHTRSYCAERYNVPCRVDEDCGPGFDCNRYPYTTCSGGGSVEPSPDGGFIFTDAGSECTTVTPETGWCALQELPCASDSECPETMSCQEQYTWQPCVPVWDASVVPSEPSPDSVADAGVGVPVDPAKDAGSWPTWDCPPPVVSHVCRPESWGSGGGFTGGSIGGGGLFGGGGDDAGISVDAGTPPSGGTPGGGGGTAAGGSYAGGGAGGAIGGPGSADAGTQTPGGGDEGEEDDDDEHGHGHHGGSLLHKLLSRLLGSGGCSVAGETSHANLAWLSALSLVMVARVRRRRG